MIGFVDAVVGVFRLAIEVIVNIVMAVNVINTISVCTVIIAIFIMIISAQLVGVFISVIEPDVVVIIGIVITVIPIVRSLLSVYHHNRQHRHRFHCPQQYQFNNLPFACHNTFLYL